MDRINKEMNHLKSEILIKDGQITHCERLILRKNELLDEAYALIRDLRSEIHRRRVANDN